MNTNKLVYDLKWAQRINANWVRHVDNLYSDSSWVQVHFLRATKIIRCQELAYTKLEGILAAERMDRFWEVLGWAGLCEHIRQNLVDITFPLDTPPLFR